MFKQVLAILAVGAFANSGSVLAGSNHGATLSKDGHVTYLAPQARSGEARPSMPPGPSTASRARRRSRR